MGLLLSFTSPLWADIGNDGDPGSDLAPARRPQASSLHPRIPAGSECERILIEAGEMIGRPLSQDEVERKMVRIIAFTGEELLDEAVPETRAPVPRKFRSCFTARMKVLTPKGERSISDLRTGDSVISIDLAKGIWIENRINQILITPDQKFGTLQSAITPLEVTPSEAFYVGGTRFETLENLNDSSNIYRVQIQPDGHFGMAAVPRGPYLMNESCATVYNLNLVGEPRNFIINGILVHNKPITVML